MCQNREDAEWGKCLTSRQELPNRLKTESSFNRHLCSLLRAAAKVTVHPGEVGLGKQDECSSCRRQETGDSNACFTRFSFITLTQRVEFITAEVLFIGLSLFSTRFDSTVMVGFHYS